MAPKVDLSNLRAALRADPDAMAELPDRTWRRYVTGEFPANMLWWLRHPDLLEALARDARGWSEGESDVIAGASVKRATAQKKYRAGSTKPASKTKRRTG